MKKLYLLLIITVNYFIQTSFFPMLQLSSVYPNTNLLITMLTGMFMSSMSGAIVGTVIGLVQDIVFSGMIGINALVLCVIGALSGLLKERLLSGRPFVVFLLATSGTIAYHFLYYFISYFFKGDITLYELFRTKVLGGLVMNVILMYPFFALFKKLFSEKTLTFIE